MSYKDISPEIASIAQNYKSQAVPPWLTKAQELLQQIYQAILQIIDNLFRLRNPGSSDSSALSTVIQYAAYLVGIIAFLVICYLLWKKAIRREEKLAATKRGAAVIEKILDSSGYKEQAKSFAAASEYKSACRSLYLCLLQKMHEKTVVVFAPAKTNFEYKYLLVSFPHLQKEFVDLADIVEHVWFGNRAAESSDYRECLRILSEAELEVEKIAAVKQAALKELNHE